MRVSRKALKALAHLAPAMPGFFFLLKLAMAKVLGFFQDEGNIDTLIPARPTDGEII